MPKDCLKCGQCCKGEIGPFIFPSDVDLIAKNIGVSSFVFLEKYCERHVFNTNFGKLAIYTAKCDSNGCVFLRNNLCKIYEVRPYQCVNSPFNFLGDYKFWEHMKCIERNDFKTVNTLSNDTAMFKQIIDIGYHSFERSE